MSGLFDFLRAFSARDLMGASSFALLIFLASILGLGISDRRRRAGSLASLAALAVTGFAIFNGVALLKASAPTADVGVLAAWPDGGSQWSTPHQSRFTVVNGVDGGVYQQVDYDGTFYPMSGRVVFDGGAGQVRGLGTLTFGQPTAGFISQTQTGPLTISGVGGSYIASSGTSPDVLEAGITVQNGTTSPISFGVEAVGQFDQQLFAVLNTGSAIYNASSGANIGTLSATGYWATAKGTSSLATSSGVGAPVVIGSASPPTAGQIVKATAATTATWQTLYLSGSTTNPTAVTALTCADTSVAVTGAAVGNGCLLGTPATVGNLSETCFVSAADTAQIHICNVTAGDITPPVGTYTVKVFP